MPRRSRPHEYLFLEGASGRRGGRGVGDWRGGRARSGARRGFRGRPRRRRERARIRLRGDPGGEGGGTAEGKLLDIRNRAEVEAALGGVDDLEGVVSTPGINVRKRVLDYSDAELDRVIDVNLKGNFHVLQAAGRILSARKKGSIVLFSSIRSLVVEPGQSVYAGTKAGG